MAKAAATFTYRIIKKVPSERYLFTNFDSIRFRLLSSLRYNALAGNRSQTPSLFRLAAKSQNTKGKSERRACECSALARIESNWGERGAPARLGLRPAARCWRAENVHWCTRAHNSVRA